eukprot:18303-Heterococcus_DN1.PRE.2
MAVDERAGAALPARPPFTRPRRPSERHRKLTVKATQIQRGYAGLDEGARCNKAATCLQKAYRGHRVRKHMPEVLQAVRAHKRWIPSTIFRMFCALQA